MILHRPLSVSYSYKLSFEVCILLEILADGAVKVVTVGNYYINYVSLMVMLSITTTGICLWIVRSAITELFVIRYW
jgi:hypothetical protein